MEETEALVSIDVNIAVASGDRKDGKNFILQATAATEACRQMKLRNLGLVSHFIDMKNKGDQRKVFQKMKSSTTIRPT